jgi:hypothetical protein
MSSLATLRRLKRYSSVEDIELPLHGGDDLDLKARAAVSMMLRVDDRPGCQGGARSFTGFIPAH